MHKHLSYLYTYNNIYNTYVNACIVTDDPSSKPDQKYARRIGRIDYKFGTSRDKNTRLYAILVHWEGCGPQGSSSGGGGSSSSSSSSNSSSSHCSSSSSGCCCCCCCCRSICRAERFGPLLAKGCDLIAAVTPCKQKVCLWLAKGMVVKLAQADCREKIVCWLSYARVTRQTERLMKMLYR